MFVILDKVASETFTEKMTWVKMWWTERASICLEKEAILNEAAAKAEALWWERMDNFQIKEEGSVALK